MGKGNSSLSSHHGMCAAATATGAAACSSTSWGASGPGLAGSSSFRLRPCGCAEGTLARAAPAGRARVLCPRPRRGRRPAASVNSLRHLATASGSAARCSFGVRPLSLAARLPREAVFQPSGCCEWGIWHMPAWRFDVVLSLQQPGLFQPRVCVAATTRCQWSHSFGRCSLAAAQDFSNAEIQGPGS